jgi:hypothetical protein
MLDDDYVIIDLTEWTDDQMVGWTADERMRWEDDGGYIYEHPWASPLGLRWL